MLITDGAFGFPGGLKQIVAEEGAVGLYRGLGPQFVALLPNWAVGLLAAVCLLSASHVLCMRTHTCTEIVNALT